MATAEMERTTSFDAAEKLKAADAGGGEVDDELEEGEIVEESNDTASYLGKEITVKHPLEHSWTFWFDSPIAKSRQTAWGSSLRNVYTFSTVEEFWGAYNNIHHPSKLVMGADFHCFKHKIEPKWEDPVCANGGTWKMSFLKGKSDTSWLYTLLAMIGHQFDHGDEICGAVVSVRSKGEKIALWTKNAANETAQVSIGKQWKQFLDHSDSVGFIFHDDAKRLDRSAKNRYTV
ncbi:eukaryotic translation initiation factor 4E allele A [Solanum tuberosum]|uniref:eukaryotic translation initiation factor 4E allele A n=1 Tax=Solanum tuberosum TaxID=4113 RepID=UPI000243FC43|nr:eukaryotic translation initiation factor 4E allele A [Solanum tuberosum]AEX01235.1 eukaryotic translation initiation factor 4E [Solanum tuberosum]QQP16450.1 eukaryotic translation initiation factor eIF4E-1 [Solanum tuberosum]WDS48438.1 eukaryotic translation initiation factor 4E [Solanum tuberosum]